MLMPVGEGAPRAASPASVGETWARLFGVTPGCVEAVGAAYERRIQERRVWSVEGTWNGARAVIARLGDAHVLATAAGYHLAEETPLCVRLPRRLRWPLRFDQLDRMFEVAADHIARIHALAPFKKQALHLSSFASWARVAAVTFARDDLVTALRAVMTEQEASHLYIQADAKASRSYSFARPPFYLRQIGAALRALRSVMPAEVQAALWGIGVPDFRLANWLMESDVHRLYRRQALRTQPLLLPLALLGRPCDELPEGSALIQARLPGAEGNPAADVGDGPDAARALLSAIDAGQPWFEQLHAFLQSGRRFVPLSPANIRWLAGRSPRFLSWSRHGGSVFDALGSRLDIAIGLPGNRRPMTWKAWKVFDAVVRALPDDSIALSPSFLKGMPCEWTDAAWGNVSGRLHSLYADAISWVTGCHFGSQVNHRVWQWMLRHATLSQVLNFSDVAHRLRKAVESAMRREAQDESEWVIRWNGALQGRRFVHADRVIVELTTADELEEEGRRLSHCVGDYAYACVGGESRIFSVRNVAGEPCSTFEIYRPADGEGPPELFVAQHCAFDDLSPVASCKKALAAFLREVRSGRIAITTDWPREMMPEDRRRMEFSRRVKEAASGELFRRWPALKQVIEGEKS